MKHNLIESQHGMDEEYQPASHTSPFRVFGARKGFELAFLISVLIHGVVLGAVFVENNTPEDPEFKMLKVQLQDHSSDKEALRQLLAEAAQAESISSIQQAKQVESTTAQAALDDSQLDANQVDGSIEVDAKPAQEEQQKAQEKLPAQPARTQAAVTPKVPQSSPKPKPESRVRANNETLGNSNEQEAEALLRYEQLLPLWLDRFRTYPAQAKARGLEGEGIVFLRIDREGKVLYASIAQSTGHQMLDDALLSMVAAANPVIPVPKDYSKELNEFSYQIAFRFKLDESKQIPVYE